MHRSIQTPVSQGFWLQLQPPDLQALIPSRCPLRCVRDALGCDLRAGDADGIETHQHASLRVADDTKRRAVEKDAASGRVRVAPCLMCCDIAGMEPDERTAVIANAARLLQDAKLLVDHTRFASAFALAVLGVEEIEKVILDIWGTAAPLSKPVVRRSAHIRKQAGVSSLLLGSFAVREFGTVVDEANDELFHRVAEAFRLSAEGQLMSQVQGGALDKTKQLGLYRETTGSRMHRCMPISSATLMLMRSSR